MSAPASKATELREKLAGFCSGFAVLIWFSRSSRVALDTLGSGDSLGITIAAMAQAYAEAVLVHRDLQGGRRPPMHHDHRTQGYPKGLTQSLHYGHTTRFAPHSGDHAVFSARNRGREPPSRRVREPFSRARPRANRGHHPPQLADGRVKRALDMESPFLGEPR